MQQTTSIQKAEEEIKPYLEKFKTCYESALIKYNTVIGSYAGSLFQRTKSTIFHNIIVEEIKSEFQEVKSTSISEKYESVCLVINNFISARFKKFNKNGLPSNARTNRNDLRIAQQLEISYLDYPPIAYVDVGYQMDITGTKYDHLKVICRQHKNVLWDLYFHSVETQAEKNTAQEFNITPIPEKQIEPRVTAKNKENKKANNQ